MIGKLRSMYFRLMLDQHFNWFVVILQHALLRSYKSKMIQFVLAKYKPCQLQPVQAHVGL